MLYNIVQYLPNSKSTQALLELTEKLDKQLFHFNLLAKSAECKKTRESV